LAASCDSSGKERTHQKHRQAAGGGGGGNHATKADLGCNAHAPVRSSALFTSFPNSRSRRPFSCADLAQYDRVSANHKS
jgi:hypothetical protein